MLCQLVENGEVSTPAPVQCPVYYIHAYTAHYVLIV